MRMYDVIKQKRDGGKLSEEQIRAFVKGYVAGEIPDYQAAALCMAIWFRGMDAVETTALTLAIRDSGGRLDASGIEGIRADKHSTGGVGDKTSLVVAPVVAALGLVVAKMSGRGLGHTGGTVDKLEAIPNFRVDMSAEEFKDIVRRTGIAIVGQSAELAPADKLLYALRDVTATVDSIPLIASSIMSKKLAADDDCILLDVKTGSGAFMKSVEESVELAELMVDIGKRAGKRIAALITDMDSPLGNTVGNTLEVQEAIETLMGKGPTDLYELCVALSARILYLSDYGGYEACEEAVRGVITSGAALRKLAEMVEAQGGDARCVYHPELLPQAKYTREVTSPRDGYVFCVDTEGYGEVALMLGAGRNKKEDAIDPTAGVRIFAKRGDRVRSGDPVACLYTTEKPEALAAAEEKLLSCTTFSDQAPVVRPLVLKVIE